MLEIVILLIFTIAIVNVELLWVQIILLLFSILLLLPGIYAMYFGAPYVPAGKEAIKAIFKLGKFTKNDRVVDLGCGDGRIIRKIAESGAKSAIGYEFSIPVYLLARLEFFLNKSRGQIKFANFWHLDFSDVDVVVCFLLDHSMKEFEKKIWPKLRSGTRVLSNVFQMTKVSAAAKENSVTLYVKK